MSGQVFPTNRGKTAQILREGPPAAVDTLAMVFPISSFDTRECAVSVSEPDGDGQQSRRYRRTLPGGGFLATGVGDVAWVEASLPKRVSGGNVVPLPLAQARDAARELFDEAGAYCEPVRSIREARLTRVDLVRDFDGVANFQLWGSGIRALRQAGRSKTMLMHDHSDHNGALTLAVGPKTSWRSYMYDKHAETDGAAPIGRVRFEARCRSELMKSTWARKTAGLGQLHFADLENVDELDGQLRLLTRGMFERVGFDREVNVMGALVHQVLSMEGLSEHEKTMLLGYVVRRGVG
ncbi:MAG: hypothetical protein LC808_23875, partial [Actinobacteria bacterium]|nr:hypothetical protein [Actinomycetota bacterium]